MLQTVNPRGRVGKTHSALTLSISRFHLLLSAAFARCLSCRSCCLSRTTLVSALSSLWNSSFQRKSHVEPSKAQTISL